MPVPPGPGRSPTVESPNVPNDDVDVSGYPIQLSKVQRPPLRDETLARNRLLDWLAAKIHHRVLCVIAEAGYGKTTLLADFSRRTRVRTLWYRLDRDDGDWVAFLNYLVAAGRELDPTFGEATAGLLRKIGPAGPTREAATKSLIRDLVAFGSDGAAVILDDYHAVDDSENVRYVVGELLAHAPERMSFVFSSRRQPAIRVARLRALGEVAELSTDDLRFNEPETEQLFRETYRHALEPDVLGDLSSRTEGWAASLQLVQAAIRDRSAGEVRRFVRSLSGAEGELYDYLAEEVIGDLPQDLQDFLMKASVLEIIDQQLAAAAAGVDDGAAAEYLAGAERIGVLGHRGRGLDASRGFHPLVHDFLRARFVREAGEESVAATHLRVAKGVEDSNWDLACHHYGCAGRTSEVHRVLRSSLHLIMGSGRFRTAAAYLDRYPPPQLEADFEVVRSRTEFEDGRRDEGISRAERAFELEPDSDMAAMNLLSMRLMVGDFIAADGLAGTVALRSHNSVTQSIAKATADLMRLSIDGSVSQFVTLVLGMADQHEQLGMNRYEGISLLNAAAALKAQGDAENALLLAIRATDRLAITSAPHEVASATLHRIWALAHLGRWGEARSEMDRLLANLDTMSKAEVFTELGTVHLWYGDEEEAFALLDAAGSWIHDRPDMLDSWRAAMLERALREGDLSAAHLISPELRRGEFYAEPGFTARCLTLDGYLAILDGRLDASQTLESASRLARRQAAHFWGRYAEVLIAAHAAGDYSVQVRRAINGSSVFLSVVAEMIVSRLAEADDDLFDIVASEAVLRPERWRPALRRVIDSHASDSRWRAGHLLDVMGGWDDVLRLSKLAKGAKGRPSERLLGRRLARHLAPRVFVEDQGRVAIRVGEHLVAGSDVRRKVLSLLCFLITKPRFSATRDQVLDALWPDLEPSVALNSLNQTVYFLRRVFEPSYQEDVSPGYLHHDSNVIWLDDELTSSRSSDCAALVRRATDTSAPGDLSKLADQYLGKFALDFAYEEWAISYRDSLHAAYLQLLETAIARDTASGHFDRAIGLARRALEVDPGAEQVEVSLLRLYRLTGAHAAAAEQYAHYANVLRHELGVEPPALETL